MLITLLCATAFASPHELRLQWSGRDLRAFFVLIIGWVLCSCAGIWAGSKPARSPRRLADDVVLDVCITIGLFFFSAVREPLVFLLWLSVMFAKWGCWLGWPRAVTLFVGLALFLSLLGGTVLAQALERSRQGFLFTDWDWPDRTAVRASDGMSMALWCLGSGLVLLSMSVVQIVWHFRRTRRRISPPGR